MPDFDGDHGIVLGVTNECAVYIQDSTGEWHVFDSYEYFKIEKRLNQMSKFEIRLPQIATDEKAYIKEFAKVLLISNMKVVLKGRIQKVTYETAEAAVIEGFGMEATILDKEYKNITRSPEDEDRVQYDNVSAQTIAKELLSTNADGLTPWTMEPRTTGIFGTDYGLISMRFEYANKLTALGNLSNAMKYDWWVDQDFTVPYQDYDKDYFNLASIKGNQTYPDATRQFTITGDYINAEGTDYQKDVTNVANFIKVIGYGDGINQLFTSTYNASPIWTTLASNISETDVNIELIDNSSFAVNGTVRIADEIITYTGKAGNYLTGCSRGTSGSTAKVHRKDCYIEKYVPSTTPEANSSISSNGLMELTITNRDIRDESTLELVASNELIDRMNPIERITITPTDPNGVAETIETGDLVSVIDAESSLNSNYRIVAIIYESNYGDLSISLEASNKSLTFIEQMQKEREKNQSLQKYMQGSTNVYVVSNSENCDNGYGCVIKTYIPTDTIAINHVLLSYSVEAYRIYNTTTANESAHTHGIPELTVNSHTHTIPSLDVDGTTTGSATPTATSGTSIWPTYTENNMSNQALGYVEQQIVGSPTIYTSRYQCMLQNVTGGSVTVHAHIETIAGNILSQGNTNLNNNSVIAFSSGESNSTSSGYFKVWDTNWAASKWSGVADIVYSHTHGSHTHSVSGQSTSSDTSGAAGSTVSSDTTEAGSAHNHGVSYGISTGSNTITAMQIFVDGTDRTAAIETALGHTLSINSTEAEIDLTSYIASTGWHTIDIRPDGTCRITGDMWNQVFIESK